MMRPALVLAGLLALGATASAQSPAAAPPASSGPAAARPHEEGRPLVRSYAPTQVGGNSQIWGIVQDKRGVIYAATGGAILEFDGAAWRRIPLDLARHGRAVDRDRRQRPHLRRRRQRARLPRAERGGRDAFRLAPRQAARRRPPDGRGLAHDGDAGRDRVPVGLGDVPMVGRYVHHPEGPVAVPARLGRGGPRLRRHARARPERRRERQLRPLPGTERLVTSRSRWSCTTTTRACSSAPVSTACSSTTGPRSRRSRPSSIPG